VQPGTGRIFVNDVGQDSWEEVDELVKGANYGWPDSEGMTTIVGHQNPFFVYKNGEGVNQEDCSIIGGAFYNPGTQQFPSDYLGAYFFGDFCSGYIKRLDTASKAVTTFATGITQLIDIKVGTDGALYYVTLGGALSRVSYTGSLAPVIGVQPTSRTVSVGQSTTFSVSASGSGPLSYQWQLNGTNIAGATAASYTRSNVQSTDNGAQFRVVVSNSVGSVTSNAAVLTVTSNQPPVANIVSPSANATYTGGAVIAFSGSASDPEDGALPASAFTWKVDFQHDAHSHPVLAATTGSTSGSFTASDRGETSSNVWYRVTLTVTDSGGLSSTVVRDIQPVKALITLATTPPGLRVKLDGSAVTTPYSFTGVAGIVRTIEAISPQLSPSGESYVHVSWSDAKAPLHEIVTPATATTFTDTLRAESAWSTLDVGSVGQAGSFTQNGTSYELRGSGDDIWNSADAFRFGYQALVGDGRITARVVSLSNTDGWAKAGVMVRESTAPGAKHAYVGITPTNGREFLRREQTDGATTPQGTSGGAPSWVRLVRQGDLFTSYLSSDGVNWTPFGSATIVMGANVRVGLAVTSHNNGVLCTGVFDSLSVVD
jgi:hypothetical protein